MHLGGFLSSFDTALLMIPGVVLTVLALFGMANRLSSSGSRNLRTPRFCEVGRDGRGQLSDPDGTRSPQSQHKPSRRDADKGKTSKR